MGQAERGVMETPVDLKPGHRTRHPVQGMVSQVLNDPRGEGFRQKKKPGR
jgi:hypothetical protein